MRASVLSSTLRWGRPTISSCAFVPGGVAVANDERQTASLVGRLRELVLAPPADAERFHVAFLDTSKRILSVAGFGKGGASALQVSLRELFQHALSVEARSILIAHNHPSGNCRPSPFDIEATQRIADVGHALGIELLDHLIFSKNALYSMRKGSEL